MSGRRLWRGIIVALVAIGVIVVAGVVWIAGGPGPMDFAGGRKVALADYRAANPTGVPAELAQADPVKRGDYLARAADCLVCHTAPGGVDSTIAAAIVNEAVGGQLHAVYVDTGFMRKGESEQVEAMYKRMGLNLTVVHASDEYGTHGSRAYTASAPCAARVAASRSPPSAIAAT